MAPAAQAAAGSVTLDVDVPSTTSLNISGCASGTSGVTDFGTVLPGGSAITSAPCVVKFGSTNDTSMLSVYRTNTGTQGAMTGTFGQLDPSFGDSGVVRTSVSSVPCPGGELDWTTGVYDPMIGAYVVAEGTYTSVCLAAYRAGGTLYTGFGTNGSVATTVGPNDGDEVAKIIYDAASQDLIVVGTASDSSYDSNMAITAFDASTGGLDPAFGTDGVVLVPIAQQAWATDVVVDTASSNLIVAGTATTASYSDEIGIVELNDTTGALNTSFNGTGILTTTPSDATDASVSGVVLDPGSGAIVIDGTASGRSSNAFKQPFLAAFDPATGAPEVSFATSGVAFPFDGTSYASADYAASVFAVDSGSGDYVFGGQQAEGEGDGGYLAEYSPSSDSLVTGFGSGGIVAVANTAVQYSQWDFSVTLDPALDDILVVGGVPNPIEEHPEAALRAFSLTNGALDTRFNGSGIVRVDANGDSELAAVFMDAGSHDLIAFGDTNAHSTGLALAVSVQGASGFFHDYTTSGLGSWSQPPGDGASLFGACLEQVSAGATTAADTWTAVGSGNCTQSDAAGVWHAIPLTAWDPDNGAKIAATSAPGQVGATVDLRFGVRAASDQAPGEYIAPISLEVDAPAVTGGVPEPNMCCPG